MNYYVVTISCTPCLQAVNTALDGAGLPFEVVDGFVNTITVSIPWSSLITDDTTVEIHGLELTVQPKQRDVLGGWYLIACVLSNRSVCATALLRCYGLFGNNRYIMLIAIQNCHIHGSLELTPLSRQYLEVATGDTSSSNAGIVPTRSIRIITPCSHSLSCTSLGCHSLCLTSEYG